MIFIVLGMHKSGTSLVSQTLHESGITMGEFDSKISYDQGNHYENNEILEVNNDLLNSHRMPSFKIKIPKSLCINDEIKQKGIEIINNQSKIFKNWGFKDPRTCFTYSFWKKIIKDQPKKVIVVFRNPLELIAHYKANTPNQINVVIEAWLDNNSCILEHIRSSNKSEIFITEYSNFINDKNELLRLSKFLETNCKNIIDAKLYRSDSSNLPFFVKWYYSLIYKKKCDKIIAEFSKVIST